MRAGRWEEGNAGHRGGGGSHSPTADSATVGFRVSLKRESQKSNAHPPATTHLGPLSLCLHFFSCLSAGAGASLGTLISGVKKILSPFSTSSTEAEPELQII